MDLKALKSQLQKLENSKNVTTATLFHLKSGLFTGDASSDVSKLLSHYEQLLVMLNAEIEKVTAEINKSIDSPPLPFGESKKPESGSLADEVA